MPYFLKHRERNFACPGFTVEHFGPFRSLDNAKLACGILARISINTGRYWDSTKVLRRARSPQRTLPWSEVARQLYPLSKWDLEN